MEAAKYEPFSPDGASMVLMGYADIYHAAERLFGLGVHSTRERIRVGKALRSLPRIEEALLSGEVSYSRAREVTRVATPEDESTWLDLARTLPMRNLERVRDLRTEGRIVRRGGPLPKAIERTVRLRDRNTCRVPGCYRRRYVDVHHIDPRSEGGSHSRANCVCLCTTHHARLHEGRLRIEGDADGELMFFDGTGAPLTGPRASQGGSAAAPLASQRGTTAAGVASQRGSAIGADASQGGSAVAMGVGEEAATLLALMGRRGGWTVDALVEASGLRVGAVHAALTCLEIKGRVVGKGSAATRPVPDLAPRATIHRTFEAPRIRRSGAVGQGRREEACRQCPHRRAT